MIWRVRISPDNFRRGLNKPALVVTLYIFALKHKIQSGVKRREGYRRALNISC